MAHFVKPGPRIAFLSLLSFSSFPLTGLPSFSFSPWLRPNRAICQPSPLSFPFPCFSSLISFFLWPTQRVPGSSLTSHKTQAQSSPLTLSLKLGCLEHVSLSLFSFVSSSPVCKHEEPKKKMRGTEPLATSPFPNFRPFLSPSSFFQSL